MGLVIRKRVSLDFLGEEYKDSYLVFRSIPVPDYENIIDEVDKLDNKKSIQYIVTTLEKYFIEGKGLDESGSLIAITQNDIKLLDGETTIKCFETLTGRIVDPKSEGQLMTQSTTTNKPPEN